MNIIITGTPGTGKTTIAQIIATELKYTVINEKQLSLELNAGEFNSENNEYEIDITKLEKGINKFLKKKSNIIIEGHVICEAKLEPIDMVIVLRLNPEILELRLEKREYSPEKIQDNVFCEGIDYCYKKAIKNYEEAKIIQIETKKSLKETKELILNEINNWGVRE